MGRPALPADMSNVFFPHKVAVIILNWKSPEDTIESLRSALASTNVNLEVFLVDNDSKDGLCDKVQRELPEVSILKNQTNLGYAGGNNAGIRAALKKGADFVFILNNDAVVNKDCIGILLETALASSHAGLMAPKVLQRSEPELIDSLGTRMDWFRLRPCIGRHGQKDDGHEKKVFASSILVGCALFVARSGIEKIGLLDENFFLIHEDADWSLRSLEAGYENLVVPAAVVYHKRSQSLNKLPALSHYYSVRNFFYLAKKHAGWAGILTFLGALFFTLKNSLVFLVGGSESKKRSRVFFMATFDFFHGAMGKCKRVFE